MTQWRCPARVAAMREAYFHQLLSCPIDEIRPVDVTNSPPWWVKREHKERMIRRSELAPDRELLDEFIARRKSLTQDGYTDLDAHNRAFEDVDYPARFIAQIEGNPDAMARLGELVREDKAREVVLVCYCGPGKACHRHLLLDLAAQHFGATVDRPS